MTMVFPGFKDGARFRPGFDHKAGAQRMQAILQRDGGLTVEALIKDARRTSSALRDAFIWDAAEALEHSHITTAQHLLTNFVVVTVADDETRSEEKAIHPVYLTEEADDRVYVKTESAFSNVALRAQVLDRAKAELGTFRRKYARFQELAGVFAAIEALDDQQGEKAA